jgi:hypothetical protein
MGACTKTDRQSQYNFDFGLAHLLLSPNLSYRQFPSLRFSSTFALPLSVLLPASSWKFSVKVLSRLFIIIHFEGFIFVRLPSAGPFRHLYLLIQSATYSTSFLVRNFTHPAKCQGSASFRPRSLYSKSFPIRISLSHWRQPYIHNIYNIHQHHLKNIII